MEVTEPFELLEMRDGEVREFHIDAWGEGTTIIKPTWAPEGKEIPVLRIWVAPNERPIGLPYWDITSKTLIAQLKPYLQRDDFRGLVYKITAFGEAPRKRFTLEASPLRAAA